MGGFTCPYCGTTMAISQASQRKQVTAFDSSTGFVVGGKGDYHYYDSSLALTFYKCPNCDQYTIFAQGVGRSVQDVSLMIRPISAARKYPDYIPQQIRADYEEAYAILHLSPKASATLSRRCLQGMIHDFWGIVEKNLNAEITALKDKIQPDLWAAMDSLRQLGNIGAHMEKDTALIVDIDFGEAEKLIKLIELLMKEWYINREERAKLFGDILQINADKQAIRKGEG